jgi:UDP-N-acetylmuramoyl-L-alanyl-D-glutamate--2,6-diaminopimelate ligase
MHYLYELLKTLPDFHLSGQTVPASLVIHSITFDSRTVRPGSLYVALEGRRLDGHTFIPVALQQGAVAIIGIKTTAALAEQGIHLPEQIVYIQTPDSRIALAHCCAAWQGFPSQHLAVIGVTGTDGKTTTCSLIEAILATATEGAADNAGRVGVITTVAARIRGVTSDTGLHVTTPDAPDVQRYLAEMVASGCQYAIVESTSHGLNQARVAAVDFDVAAVTNITHEHLDEHGTRDAYVVAKAKLFRFLYHSPAKTGIPRCAVLNADDVGSFAALQAVLAEEAAQSTTAVAIRSYGLAGRAAQPGFAPDVTAKAIMYAPNGTHFTVNWWGGEFPMTSPLIGEFNVSNVLCATTVALALGVAHFPGVLGRMERFDRGQPFLALVDFAHTPDSLERALLTLRQLVGVPGRLIAVFGSAGLRDREKRYLMGKVGGRLADFTVITAEDPRIEDLQEINAEIARGVREYTDASHFVIVPDRAEAIQQAVDMAQPGDVVAAFGKGHERSMCYGTVEYPWSDQAVLAAALEAKVARDG